MHNTIFLPGPIRFQFKLINWRAAASARIDLSTNTLFSKILTNPDRSVTQKNPSNIFWGKIHYQFCYSPTTSCRLNLSLPRLEGYSHAATIPRKRKMIECTTKLIIREAKGKKRVKKKDLNRFTGTKQVQILAYSVCKCKIKISLKVAKLINFYSHSHANQTKKSKKEDLVKMYMIFLASCQQSPKGLNERYSKDTKSLLLSLFLNGEKIKEQVHQKTYWLAVDQRWP